MKIARLFIDIRFRWSRVAQAIRSTTIQRFVTRFIRRYIKRFSERLRLTFPVNLYFHANGRCTLMHLFCHRSKAGKHMQENICMNVKVLGSPWTFWIHHELDMPKSSASMQLLQNTCIRIQMHNKYEVYDSYERVLLWHRSWFAHT